MTREQLLDRIIAGMICFLATYIARKINPNSGLELFIPLLAGMISRDIVNSSD